MKISNVSKVVISSGDFSGQADSFFGEYFTDKFVYLYNPKAAIEKWQESVENLEECEEGIRRLANERLVLASAFEQNVIPFKRKENISVRSIPNYNG
ncbi:hypothetical protein, partial [Treponema sp. R6D11]